MGNRAAKRNWFGLRIGFGYGSVRFTDENENELESETSPKRPRFSMESPFLDLGGSQNERMETSQTESSCGNAVHPQSIHFGPYLLGLDVLKNIFGNLGLFDLLQMCDIDDRFEPICQDIMKDRGVLNISEISKHYSVRHALKKFGTFVREVSIKESDIQWKNEQFSHTEEITRLIGKRCCCLEKVTITFDRNEDGAHLFRQPIPDSMRTIESLTVIREGTYRNHFDKWLKAFLFACPQLQSLTLNCIYSPGSFLTDLNAMNLRELFFKNCVFTEATHWDAFINKGIASLKTLGWNYIGIMDRGFSMGNLNQIDVKFPLLEKILMNIGCHTYQLPLNQMTHLKSLHISCFWYCTRIREFLEMLKTMDMLEELSIDINERYNGLNKEDVKQMWLDTMRGLENLQSITIQFSYYPIDWKDVIDLMRELPNVKAVHLIGKRNMLRKHIEDLVALSPAIQSIKVNAPIKLTPKLYCSLVKSRSYWFRRSPKLNIYINGDNLRDVKSKIDDYATKSRCIGLHPI